MRNQWDYWSAWMAGWSMAARTMFDMQQRMLEQFLAAPRPPAEQRGGAGPDVRATRGAEARGEVEVAPPAAAGDKPRRRRPGAAAPSRGGGRPSRRKAARQRGD